MDDVHINMDYITNSINVVEEYRRVAFGSSSGYSSSIYYSPGSRYVSSLTGSTSGVSSTYSTSRKGMIVIIRIKKD